jgi:hypothetical protein
MRCILAIFKVTPREIERGELSRLLQLGQAVVLTEDERISGLFRLVLDWLGLNETSTDKESLFEMNLLDLARNHRDGNMQAGDMLRFLPARYGHLARKFLVCSSSVNQSLEAFPDAFYLRDRRVPVPRMVLEWSWDVMCEVFKSAVPKHANMLNYAVEVDIFIYPRSASDINKLHALMADSGEFWSRLGHRMDASKATAVGMFDKKLIRDLFGVASLIPGIRRFARILNNRMLEASEKSVPEDYQLIGSPHVDGTKYISGLAGWRDNVHTQILSAKRWLPLPVTADSLALVPARKITSVSEIHATRHRVLLRNGRGNESTVTRNITLSLAIVDRPANLAWESSSRARTATANGYARQEYGQRGLYMQRTLHSPLNGSLSG